MRRTTAATTDRTGRSPTGPTETVLAEISAGTPTLAEIARNTGLDRGLVEMVVSRLVLAGEVAAEPLQIGCPAQGCGGCALGSRGRPGCGASAHHAGRSGPVPVSLSVRR